MSTQSYAMRVPREQPSKVTKDRLAQILQQEVLECGRVARQLCRQSGSREVLMKAAKKMASREVAMESTLSNLRQIEQMLEKSSEQVHLIGQRIEHTNDIQKELTDMTGMWIPPTSLS